MAIVQISQITNRKGYNSNLPQLAGAEFGWSTDTRQLYIGNGTLEEGAPVIGNTEILTEFSDLTPVPITVTLADDTASPTTAFRLTAGAVVFSYTIVRGGVYQAGTVKIAGNAFNDSPVGNAGITLSATYSSGQIDVKYTSTPTGTDAQLNYLVSVST
jgi:Major tropism determinant N-terminal domain